jgi:hypothetical protein
LAVVDFDAVCHGNGMRRDWMGCRETPAGGVKQLLANRWGSRSGLAGLPQCAVSRR